MEKNGVLEGKAARFGVSDETMQRIRHEEALKKEADAGQRAELQRYLQETAESGVQLENEDYLVDVAGFKGKLADAPDLDTATRPPLSKDVLWCEKVKPGEKGTFLIYSPAMYGVFTHFRGSGIGTVLCFKDRSLCVGGHDTSSIRWHGFLHAFHFEKRRQVFVHFTPEGSVELTNQLEKDVSLRGLKIEVRRSKAPKGPFYVQVIGHSDVPVAKLPKHRDPKASVFRMFKIKPTGRMKNAALSGGEEEGSDG